jgi:PAS domain S-box-containing protein
MVQVSSSPKKTIGSMLAWLDQKLLQPHTSIKDIALQKKSLLLSIFLLVFIIIFAGVDIAYLLTVPGYVPPWYGYVFLVGSYALNRIGKYKLASALTISMFPIVVFSNMLEGASANPLATLNYLILSIILGSILLQKRLLVLLAFVNSIGILLMIRYAPDLFPDTSVVVGPLSTLLIGAALVLVSMLHRDQIEKERQRELSLSEERLRLALDAAKMGSWDWNIKANEVKWSSSVEPLFCLEAGEFEGAFESYLELIHEDDRESVQEEIERAVRGEIQDYQVVHRIICPDCSVRWLEGKGKVYFGTDGKPTRMSGTVTDITSRKQYESEREELISELETKNAELERFTYTVSHDLKSPLITISGFLGQLQDDIASGKTDRIEDDSQRIQHAVEKMHQLLKELLELSRIGRLMNPPEPVPFESLVREALVLVHGQLELRGVTFTLGPDLPIVYGDRLRLIEVLQNLIDNAVKFMGDQPNPHIEIGQQGEEDGKPVFYVKDNGIGVLPEYHERIFGLFDKLDANSEGTGIGLALVKRIVEYHGGRIWVESEAGKGTTFFFSLSSNDEQLQRT